MLTFLCALSLRLAHLLVGNDFLARRIDLFRVFAVFVDGDEWLVQLGKGMSPSEFGENQVCTVRQIDKVKRCSQLLRVDIRQ